LSKEKACSSIDKEKGGIKKNEKEKESLLWSWGGSLLNMRLMRKYHQTGNHKNRIKTKTIIRVGEKW